jgi:glutathione synthase/RimK-type ligase-like ATP-grasp enzyme
MTKVAFAISNEFPNLTDDDKLAAAALRARQIGVDATLWDDAAVDWKSYDAVVVRSCWDYHHRLDEFLAWLARLEAAGVEVYNQPDVMRWNMDKSYLSDLQDRGVAVLPSVWLPKGAHAHLDHLLAEKGWSEAVVKPTVSAAADNTFRAAADSQAKLDDLLTKGGVIVQEFAPEIQAKGEWSFMFFDKQFSHAVLKRPQAGDFRVQRNYGGTYEAAEAPAVLVHQAGEILAAVEADVLYARVDVIERDGKLFLMELELVEPHLFFEQDGGAAERFANALASQLAVKQ